MKTKKLKTKDEDDAKKALNDFFTIARTNKKDITLEEIRRLEEESYDKS